MSKRERRHLSLSLMCTGWAVALDSEVLLSWTIGDTCGRGAEVRHDGRD